jgi:sulfate transport system ATP-binding protein
VFALLRLVQLDRYATRYPSQLSGGQRQRVALARALAVEPKVLLLDEPFGALDAKVRQELRRWLRRLHEEIHVTSVFVTHDQEEALEIADRVVIMNEGRIEQIGTPEEVYAHPTTPFTYHFLGDVNIFHGRMENGKAVIGPAPADRSEEMGSSPSSRGEVFVRPHLLEISMFPVDNSSFRGKILHINPAGPFVKVELIDEWGHPIQANITHEAYRRMKLEKDMAVYVVPKEVRSFLEEEIQW